MKMDSRKVIEWHIKIFTIFGMWPTKNQSIFYSMWTIIFCISVNIGFTSSLVACFLFVDSINEVIDQLVVTSTIVMVATKGIRFSKLSKLNEFSMHATSFL